MLGWGSVGFVNIDPHIIIVQKQESRENETECIPQKSVYTH